MPEKIEFTLVQRPGGSGAGLPANVVEAIEATTRSGKALRIDTSQWSATRRTRFYRQLFTHGKTTPYVLHRRRTDDGSAIYAWGVPK